MIDIEFAQKATALIKGRSASEINQALLFTLATVVFDSDQNHDLALTTLEATLAVADLLGTIPGENSVSRVAQHISGEKLTVDQERDEEVAEDPEVISPRAKFSQKQAKKKVSDLREGDKILGQDGKVLATCLENARRPGDGSYNVQVQTVDSEIKRMEWDEDEQNPEIDVLVTVVA